MSARHDRPPALGERTLRVVKAVRQRLRPAPVPATAVWVAGVQRSGTNLLMKIFDRAHDSDVFHETDPRAFERYEMRPTAVISALVARSRAVRVVVKSLCELQSMSALLNDFPGSRCVWVWRDVEAVADSMVASFGNFVRQAGALARDTESMDWRGRGMSLETQHFLQDVVTQALDERSAAALMWYYRNVLFFEQGLQRDPRVRLVCYDDLIAAPHDVLPEVFGFAGISYHPRCAHLIGAGSVIRASGSRPQMLPVVAARCAELSARLRALTPPLSSGTGNRRS